MNVFFYLLTEKLLTLATIIPLDIYTLLQFPLSHQRHYLPKSMRKIQLTIFRQKKRNVRKFACSVIRKLVVSCAHKTGKSSVTKTTTHSTRNNSERQSSVDLLQPNVVTH